MKVTTRRWRRKDGWYSRTTHEFPMWKQTAGQLQKELMQPVFQGMTCSRAVTLSFRTWVRHPYLTVAQSWVLELIGGTPAAEVLTVLAELPPEAASVFDVTLSFSSDRKETEEETALYAAKNRTKHKQSDKLKATKKKQLETKLKLLAAEQVRLEREKNMLEEKLANVSK